MANELPGLPALKPVRVAQATAESTPTPQINLNNAGGVNVNVQDTRQRFQADDPRKARIQIEGTQSGDKGAVNATPQTSFRNDNSIPEFLQGLVEPYIKRKQDEQFARGVVDQMTAPAESNLIDDNATIVDKIWGPSYYMQGASMYKANEAVANLQRDWQENRDELKLMEPKELSKKLAADFAGLRTGNEWVDNIVQANALKTMLPEIDTVAKARTLHYMNMARSAMVDAGSAQGSNMQRLTVEQMKNSPGSIPPAVTAQLDTFSKNVLIKPEGMTDEAFAGGLFDLGQRLMQNGDFYAYEAIKPAIQDIISNAAQNGEAKVDRLEQMYKTRGDEKLAEARSTLFPEMQALDAGIQLGYIKDPVEIGKAYAELNSKVRRMTGVDRDLFDPAAVEQAGGRVVDVMAQTARRNEERAYSEAQKLDERNYQEQQRAAEASAKLGMAQFALASGNIKAATDQDVPTSVLDTLAMQSVAAGDFKSLVPAFAVSHWVSEPVKNSLQAGVETAIGIGPTGDFKMVHKQFEAALAANPGMAMTLYGKQFAGMLRYHEQMQVKGMTEGFAFNHAFRDPLQNKEFKPVTKEVRESIAKSAKELKDPGLFPTNLNPSSQRAWVNAITPRVAELMDSSSFTKEAAIAAATEEQKAGGKWENYGQYGWQNANGTTPLHQLIDSDQKTTGAILDAEVNRLMKSSGYKAPISQEIWRDKDNVFMRFMNADGEAKNIQISVPRLKQIRKALDEDKQKRWTVTVVPGSPDTTPEVSRDASFRDNFANSMADNSTPGMLRIERVKPK